MVCFQPYALTSIFGIDGSELTNTYADLNFYLKNELAEKLSGTDSFLARTKLLSDFLLRRIADNKNRFPVFTLLLRL
ncbi:hypothetical protein CHA01nite_05290 [Chryseobacterium hagamense]|uniref:Uncharacterized protein n=1 Tax=Chryseobacterium hagamense TaxID=395935 RepID=A0A511YHW6_9FLAO|nr:hypothetical protein CHA01nite_05290 [Chryseobacterium hagamense]